MKIPTANLMISFLLLSFASSFFVSFFLPSITITLTSGSIVLTIFFTFSNISSCFDGSSISKISFVATKSTTADFTPSILFDSLSILEAQLAHPNPSSKTSFFNIFLFVFSLTFILLSILCMMPVVAFISSSYLLISCISIVNTFVTKLLFAE